MTSRFTPSDPHAGCGSAPHRPWKNSPLGRAWSASLAGATALLTVGSQAAWAIAPAAAPRPTAVTNSSPSATADTSPNGADSPDAPDGTASTTESSDTAEAASTTPPPSCPRDTGRAAVRLELPQGPTLTETSGFQATVTVRNQTSDTWTSPTLQLNLTSKPFATRDRLDAWLGGRAEPIEPIHALDLPETLEPGHEFTTTVSLTADQLAQQWEAPEWGAYGVSVEVTDGSTVLHSARSAVIGEAQGVGAPTVPLVVIAPLTAGDPDLLLGGVAPENVARELAPGNRLYEQYQTANLAGVTWVVDPALLAKAAAKNTMPVLRTSTSQGPGQASSEELSVVSDWQASIVGGAGRGGMMTLPYLDPDVAALAAAGRGDVVKKGVALGAQVWDDAGVEVPPVVAWPEVAATGVSVEDLVAEAADVGATVFVAPPPSVEDRAATPSVARVDPGGDTAPEPGEAPDRAFADSGEGAMTALWPNPTVSNELNALDEASSYDSPFDACVSTSNRLASTTSSTLGLIMAELAVSGVESSHSENTQVVVFDRSWGGPPGAGASIATHLLNAPWIEPTTPDDATPKITGVTIPPSQVADFSGNPAGGNAPHWTQTLSVIDDINLALSLLADPPEGYADQVAAALASMGWRRDSEDWDRAVSDLHDYIETALKAVTVEPGSSVTVVAEQVEIPVTIVNRFSEPAHVSVRLRATKHEPGLQPGDSQDITIPANTQQKVQFPVTALANGKVNVTAEVSTINGDTVTISEPVTVVIRKELETHLIAWASLALTLLVAVGVFRSIRKSRGAPTASAEQPAPPTPES